MKMYMLRNVEGEYLNTDYQSRHRHGSWRAREDARLYKSKQGIKSALSYTAFPAMKAHIGMEDYQRPVGVWTEEDRKANSALFQGIAAIKSQLWWDLLAQDGYQLIELDI